MVDSSSEIAHKKDIGRYYKGIPIHAAEGLHEAVAELIARRLSKGEQILELGAGSGAMAKRLCDMGFSIHAVDLNASTWACPDIPVQELDLNKEDWPLSISREFPCVLAMEVVEHLENPKGFFRNLSKVVAAGGLCIVTTPNVLNARSLSRFLKKGQFYCFSPQLYFETGHISILPYWLLHLFAKNADFQVLETHFVGRLYSKPLSILKNRLLSQWLRILRPKEDKLFFQDDEAICCLILQKHA
ncbi:MAG: class I SAM-dependent methyltransferase [Dissulfuribacterales bacterium]